MSDKKNYALPRAATGIKGLDHILGSGLMPNRMHLVQGDPGTGKTTLAMQFLMEGVRIGESGLYVTLSEGEDELRSMAASHGWSLDGITIQELIPSEDQLSPDAQYTMYHPSEVELSETTGKVIEVIESHKPRRVVFDSLSDMRLLAQNLLRYRRQILALKQYFLGKNCTVLLLDDRTSDADDLHLRSIAHGVLSLEQLEPEFGGERRRMRIVKMRSTTYQGGAHDFRIVRGGIELYPRLIAAEHETLFQERTLPSGIEELDALVGGGLPAGTSTLLMGPAGSGKSSIAMQYAVCAAERGERSAFFLFDEGRHSMLARARSLGMNFDTHLENGLITVQQIDPAEMSPGEFVDAVRAATEGRHKEAASVIVIDSLNGYMQAMPEERFLAIQLHELLSYLNAKGVLSFLVVAQHGIIGENIAAPVDASYLADSVIITRYFEVEGAMRQAVSVMKKRTGNHERTIRELHMSSNGLSVGPPLNMYRGILGGTPQLAQSGSAAAPENGM